MYLMKKSGLALAASIGVRGAYDATKDAGAADSISTIQTNALLSQRLLLSCGGDTVTHYC